VSNKDHRPQPGQVLIRSKLERPPVPDRMVARPRLLELLSGRAGHRVTLISAPAGYGKTSLALQCLDAWAGKVAWLSLDETDRDPERFARYLIEALCGLSDDGFRRSRALLEARTAPPWPYFSEVLVADLEGLSEPAVLALEDYHLIDTLQIHELMELMVERLPPALRIGVITRVDPPWPLMRWRAQGWLAEVRARDLRFSVEETGEFFATSTNLSLEGETVALLQQRTEGWIAVLRLAQLSLSESDDPDRDGRELSGSDRHIADYLMDEVLAHQSADVLELLAASALLRRFTVPLVDHLLAGRKRASDVRQILSDIERHNLFLVSLDDRRQWYRWHHLFRDLLLDHLQHLVSPEFRRRVDREAGAWFARHGLVEEALRHWIAAGELDAAAELVGTHLHPVIAEDLSCRVLSQWLEMFPPTAIARSLPLLAAEGYRRIVRWDLPGLEELSRQAEALETEPPSARDRAAVASSSADIEAQRSFRLYWQGDIEGSLECARRALGSAPPVGTRPWGLGMIYRSLSLALKGSYREAMQLLDDAVGALGPENPSVAELILAQMGLSIYDHDLKTCRDRCRLMLELNDRVPLPVFWTSYAHYFLGVVAYEQNLLDEAEACFRCLEDLRYVVPSRVYQDALIGLSLVARARGDEQALGDFCRAARAYSHEVGDPTSLRIISSFELRLAVLRDLPLPDSLEAPPADDHTSAWLEVPTVTWAMRLIADPVRRVRESALDFVDDALARMQRHHNRRLVVVLSILRALALDVRGQREAALESLAETVRLAKARGLVRSFVDCGPQMRELLDELAKRPGSSEYTATLCAAFDRGEPRRGPRVSDAFGPSEDLTFRELETLELLAWRMTNKEIADRLSVSSAAVKKRLESIYAKLEVNDRRAAVAEAAARGLIDPPAR